ncbi:Monocarboxylate transporter 14 [Araneus ventricosus]|uniref:Monocarboxylate transporter 14 n=1 Tax=Araneus ventricosus TaxID=182803 RepID=A0A4Y2GQ02_ARAVE|nr:Monocarboxylate transporter 14 [Araneus ventricosus]
MSSSQSVAVAKDPNIDGGWGWMIVFSTFIIHVITDGVMFSFGVFYQPFLEFFETTGALASLVMSIFVGTCCVAGPLASALVNKYGCRVVSILGTVVSCLGFLLSIFASNIWLLFLTIGVISGVGFGLIYLPTIVSVALHFNLKRSSAMGISMAGSGIGSMAFAPFLEWLISYYGSWKGALLITTGLTLHCFIFSFFYREFEAVVEIPIPLDEEGQPSLTEIQELVDPFGLPLPLTQAQPSRQMSIVGSNIYLRRQSVASNQPGLMQKPDILYFGSAVVEDEATDEETQHLPVVPSTIPSAISSLTAQREPCLGFAKTLREMLRVSLLGNYVFLVFSLSSLLHYFGLTAPLVFIVHRSTEMNIADSSQGSLLLSIMGVTNMLGKVIVGFWADKTKFSRLNIYSILLLVNGVATMMTSLITQYYQMAVYSAVFGLTVGGSLSLSSIVMVDLLGMDSLNNAYGIFLLVTGISTFVGTPLTGIFHDMTGNYDLGFWAAGGMVILGSLLLFAIPPIQKRFPQ